jgi:hypothetical protein
MKRLRDGVSQMLVGELERKRKEAQAALARADSVDGLVVGVPTR